MPKVKRSMDSALQESDDAQGKVMWKGPMEEGITQSLLSLFLVCRERFRLRVVEGITGSKRFSHRLEYGHMWHRCERASATKGNWKDVLKRYAQKLVDEHKGSITTVEQINHWYNVCRTQYPIYREFWSGNKEKGRKESVLAEQTFCVPYHLPSGRVVKMLGVWDGVTEYTKRRFMLDEHKTKGEIDNEEILRQLFFDHQTMFYYVALKVGGDKYGVPSDRVCGIRYNTVRRPLSGGKHSIKPLKNVNTGKRGPDGEKLPAREETMPEYYERLGGLIQEDPEHYFSRFCVDEITDQQVDYVRETFLDPVLEQLCDWWESINTKYVKDNPFNPWVTSYSDAVLAEAGPGASTTHPNTLHWRTPYGIYNPLGEGKRTDVDDYMDEGLETGIRRNVPLFEELGRYA